MSWPELVFYIAVISRTLISILDQQADWCPGRLPFKHAGENADPVSFFTLRGMTGLSRSTALEIGLKSALPALERVLPKTPDANVP